MEHDGESWFKFCVDYTYGFSRFQFYIYARDAQEAEAMLACIKATAEITGVVLEEIDA